MVSSSVLYFVADFYPWWGIPLGFLCLEIANSGRRHGNKPKMILYVCLGVLFLLTAAAYFVFDGRERLRPAMQGIERSFSGK